MLDLTGALAIVRSSTFVDQFQLVQIVKETRSTLTIRVWNWRSNIWETAARRNDKHVIQIVANDHTAVSAEQLNLFAKRMESYTAACHERIRNSKHDLVRNMESLKLS